MKRYSYLLLLVCTALVSNGCLDQGSEAAAGPGDTAEAQPLRSRNVTFSGEYLSPAPDKIDKGSFYTNLSISRIKGSDSLSVCFSSAKVKDETCCSFSGMGAVKRDTLFVPINNRGGAVVMAVVHTQDTGRLSGVKVFTLNPNDRYALRYFCCGGGSLEGAYYYSDPQHDRADTVKADDNRAF